MEELKNITNLSHLSHHDTVNAQQIPVCAVSTTCPAVVSADCPAVVSAACPAVVSDACPPVVGDACPAVVSDACPAVVSDACPAVVSDVCPSVVGVCQDCQSDLMNYQSRFVGDDESITSDICADDVSIFTVFISDENFGSDHLCQLNYSVLDESGQVNCEKLRPLLKY